MTTETTAPAQAEQPTLEELVLAIAGRIANNEAVIAELKSEAAKVTAENDSLKAELRQRLDFGTHPFGNIKVTISKPSRSFDADAFMKSYPVELNPALYKSVINTQALPPALKDQFMAEGTGEPKVSVK